MCIDSICALFLDKQYIFELVCLRRMKPPRIGEANSLISEKRATLDDCYIRVTLTAASLSNNDFLCRFIINPPNNWSYCHFFLLNLIVQVSLSHFSHSHVIVQKGEPFRMPIYRFVHSIRFWLAFWMAKQTDEIVNNKEVKEIQPFFVVVVLSRGFESLIAL